VPVEGLAQGLGLHHVGVEIGAVRDRADAAGEPLLVDMHDELDPELPRPPVAERDHVAELPGRVDMEQRKRQPARMEGLLGEVEEDGGILADRVEQDRVLGLRHDLAQDVDALGLEALQMREPRRGVGVEEGGGGHAWSSRVEGSRAGAPGRAGLTCRPHSFLASSSHHQRPARSGSPTRTARVQGAQPIDGKPRSCRGL
jgi:hypothetical protein